LGHVKEWTKNLKESEKKIKASERGFAGERPALRSPRGKKSERKGLKSIKVIQRIRPGNQRCGVGLQTKVEI